MDYPDEWHSDDEERSIAIGPIASGLISVVYTERGAEIRLISARRPTPREIKRYREGMEGKG